MIPSEPEGELLDRCRTASAIAIEELASDDIMVLAPHPDDETFGCGMAIASAVAAGKRVVIIAITAGEASHPGSPSCPPETLAVLRRSEFGCAVKALGSGRIETVELGFPDGNLNERNAPEIVRAIEPIVNRFQLSTIWASWSGDPHCDHEAVAEVAKILARKFAIPLWSYAIWGRFGPIRRPFREVRLFDDPATRVRKRDAAACYRSQTTDLIADAPDGFIMPELLLRHFLASPEIFVAEHDPEDAN